MRGVIEHDVDQVFWAIGTGCRQRAHPHQCRTVAVEHDNAAVGADCVRARDALASLPAKQREVIELGYFRGMSCREIATRCDIPLGTVKSRLSGALSRLRQQLGTGPETGT